MGSGETNTAAPGRSEGERPRTQLALRGELREDDLDALCAELEAADGAIADIDLGGLEGLEPVTLAVLVATLRDRAQRGTCDLLRAIPCSDSLACCLDARGVAALVEPEGGRWQAGADGRVLGWKAFASGEGSLTAAATVVTQLGQHTAWPQPSCGALAGLALEIAENVRQHSASSEGALAIEIDRQAERVRLAIADTGIGIRASLARNPEFSDIDDDLVAIETAMKAGETGEPGSGGGMGLYLARAMVRGNDGRILLRSGEASCEENEKRVTQRRLVPLRGTLIGIEARTDRVLATDGIGRHLSALAN